MGNGLSPCLHPAGSESAAVRLVYWGGQARLVATADGAITAGDVAAELPAPATDHVVCPADAFFVGLPVPVMSPGEELLPGRAYFVLPAARFPCGLKALTAATLAALSPNATNKLMPLAGGPASQCPFEYVKAAGGGGAALIRVLPAFIEAVITSRDAAAAVPLKAPAAAGLCSTPELKRHYAQLVGARAQAWSPRLDTIAEGGGGRRTCCRWRMSPARIMLSSSTSRR